MRRTGIGLDTCGAATGGLVVLATIFRIWLGGVPTGPADVVLLNAFVLGFVMGAGGGAVWYLLEPALAQANLIVPAAALLVLGVVGMSAFTADWVVTATAAQGHTFLWQWRHGP